VEGNALGDTVCIWVGLARVDGSALGDVIGNAEGAEVGVALGVADNECTWVGACCTHSLMLKECT